MYCKQCGTYMSADSTVCPLCSTPAAPAAAPSAMVAAAESDIYHSSENVYAAIDTRLPSSADKAADIASLIARSDDTRPAQPGAQPASTLPCGIYRAAQTDAEAHAARVQYEPSALQQAYAPLETGHFFLYMLLFRLPVLGLILALYTAFSKSTNYNLRSYARASLLWGIVMLCIVLAAAAWLMLLYSRGFMVIIPRL